MWRMIHKNLRETGTPPQHPIWSAPTIARDCFSFSAEHPKMQSGNRGQSSRGPFRWGARKMCCSGQKDSEKKHSCVGGENEGGPFFNQSNLIQSPPSQGPWNDHNLANTNVARWMHISKLQTAGKEDKFATNTPVQRICGVLIVRPKMARRKKVHSTHNDFLPKPQGPAAEKLSFQVKLKNSKTHPHPEPATCQICGMPARSLLQNCESTLVRLPARTKKSPTPLKETVLYDN